MKSLFINDNASMMRALRNLFGDVGALFVVCVSVTEAMKAIDEHCPDVVFLDHSLTDGGNEGFEIVAALNRRCRIISTTADDQRADEYRAMGIEHVSLRDVQALRALLGK